MEDGRFLCHTFCFTLQALFLGPSHPVTSLNKAPFIVAVPNLCLSVEQEFGMAAICIVRDRRAKLERFDYESDEIKKCER